VLSAAFCPADSIQYSVMVLRGNGVTLRTQTMFVPVVTPRFLCVFITAGPITKLFAGGRNEPEFPRCFRTLVVKIEKTNSNSTQIGNPQPVTWWRVRDPIEPVSIT
jgi:heme A synthase